MLDWQKWIQQASVEVARSERQKFTGDLRLLVQYRNGIARRAHISRTERRVLNRQPIDGNLDRPEREFERKKSEIQAIGPNADSEICISYTFFRGSAVDIQRNITNIST